VDADGVSDLVVADGALSTVTVVRVNTAQTEFALRADSFDFGGPSSDVAAGDVDGDGFVDIVAATANGYAIVLSAR
jgi:hypothetical protein